MRRGPIRCGTIQTRPSEGGAMPIDPDVEVELGNLRAIIAEVSASLQNQINKLSSRLSQLETAEPPVNTMDRDQ